MVRSVLPAALFALLLCGLAGCGSEERVLESDKALFLRAADLGAFGFRYENTEAYERFSKTRLFDGSQELKYEFQTPQTERERPLFIHIVVSVQRKASDAELHEGAGKIGLLVGFKRQGVEEQEIADSNRYGDSSRLAVLVKDGKPIGNTFVVRDGAKMYLLIMSGLYFSDPGVWRKAIRPKLQRLSDYSPA